MFKLTAAIMALTSTVAAVPKFVPCDPQLSCDAVLSKGSKTPVTGSKCYIFYPGKAYENLDKTLQSEYTAAGFPSSDKTPLTGCFTKDTMKTGFGKLNFNSANFSFKDMIDMEWDVATNLQFTAEGKTWFWLMDKPMSKDQI